MATATSSSSDVASGSSSHVAPMFTCLSCSIAYYTPEDQRAHYQTDLHRYNMKRRVANLPPVRADVFQAKQLESHRQAEEQETTAGSLARTGGGASRSRQAASTSENSGTGKCQQCNKSFASAGAHQSHMNSKKHKETVANASKSKGTPDRQGAIPLDASKLIVRLPKDMNDLRVSEDATEEEVAAAIDARLASSKRIDPETSCIFCKATGFGSLDESLEHMSSVHSFFIPEREYLTDKAGLMRYLSDKICVGNICLYCNGSGRGFATAEAVRKHMIDKSHCKIAYEAEEDKLELSDFYDFTSSYPDAQWEDVSDDDSAEAGDGAIAEEGSDSDDDTLPAGGNDVHFGDSEYELVLPSGVRLGHRSMRRYYNQALRPTGSAYADLRDSDAGNTGRALAHRLTQRGGMRLHVNQDPAHDQTLVTGRNGQLIKARSRGEAREAKKHISTYRDAQRREMFKTQMGYKNNAQKHFRDPLLQ